MYKRPIIPAGFIPPPRMDGVGFHLRMLTIHDVVKDFDAVMAAGTRLHGVTEPDSTRPDSLTLEENLIDLAWHQREFTIGHSFAYTVMNHDESRCLGCCYINPSDWPGHDVVALYWARDPAMDARIGAAFRTLVAQFPFRHMTYMGRDQPWPAD
ncbi:MAG: hypothetical protein ABIV25_10030 [Paracoccaceae bacterium]